MNRNAGTCVVGIRGDDGEVSFMFTRPLRPIRISIRGDDGAEKIRSWKIMVVVSNIGSERIIGGQVPTLL